MTHLNKCVSVLLRCILNIFIVTTPQTAAEIQPKQLIFICNKVHSRHRCVRIWTSHQKCSKYSVYLLGFPFFEVSLLLGGCCRSCLQNAALLPADCYVLLLCSDSTTTHQMTHFNAVLSFNAAHGEIQWLLHVWL